MKKIILSLIGIFSAIGIMAQPTFVSTTPSNKNVVLEEYTGINCGYCPDGHKIANQIATANPNRVIILNIHQGPYAGSSPNYKTQWGDALAAQTGLTGYPTGTINRRIFTGGATALGRGSWNQAAGIVMAEPSFVNVAAKAYIDTLTRIITIDVEVYYTGDAASDINMLNVALLQDSVLGPQSGATNFNPTQMINGQYIHMHMFRHLFSNQYGDPLVEDGDVIPSGSFFSKKYVYQLPANINNIPLVLKNLHVAAFIAKNTQEIYTGDLAEMNFGQYTDQVNEKIFASLITSSEAKDCSDTTDAILTFKVKNTGVTPINSIVIKYKEITGNSYPKMTNAGFSSFTYSTPIAAGTTANILLPDCKIPYDNSIKRYFAFISELDSLNVNSSELHGGAFYGSLKTPHQTKSINGPIKFYLKTDKYGSEVKWNIKDVNGNIINQGGPYTDGAARFDTVEFNITDIGCYIFTITDSWGDGLVGSSPAGIYKLVDGNGNIITTSNGNYGAKEQRPLNVLSIIGLNEVENIISSINVYPNPAKDNATLDISLAQSSLATINVVDIMGRNVIDLGTKSLKAGQNTIELNTSNLNNGMYFVKVASENGVVTKKITINR